MYLTPKSQKYNWMSYLQFHTFLEHYKQSMSIWGDLKKILKFSVKLPSFLQKEKRQGQTKVQFVIHFYPSPPPPPLVKIMSTAECKVENVIKFGPKRLLDNSEKGF